MVSIYWIKHALTSQAFKFLCASPPRLPSFFCQFRRRQVQYARVFFMRMSPSFFWYWRRCEHHWNSFCKSRPINKEDLKIKKNIIKYNKAAAASRSGAADTSVCYLLNLLSMFKLFFNYFPAHFLQYKLDFKCIIITKSTVVGLTRPVVTQCTTELFDLRDTLQVILLITVKWTVDTFVVSVGNQVKFVSNNEHESESPVSSMNEKKFSAWK